MKEFVLRFVSGVLFVTLIVSAAMNKFTFLALMFVFGFICLKEFNKLIEQKNSFSYFIFAFLFFVFSFLEVLIENSLGIHEASQILHVISIFVLLFLTRDLFSSKSLPKLLTNRYINTTFYISGGIIFIVLIPFSSGIYNQQIIIGMFVLIWINDTFAYLIGSNYGRQKLFESVSPKKTVEGFLGGVFFALSRGISATLIALIVSLQPILTSFLAKIYLNETLTKYQWIGIFFGFKLITLNLFLL